MSDLHLGKKEKEENLPSQEDRFSTFYKIISLAREHDILLIAGDLIDIPEIEEKELKIIKQHFNLLKENNTQIIILPVQGEANRAKEISILKSLDVSYIITGKNLKSPYAYENNKNPIFIYGAEQDKKEKILEIEKIPAHGFHIGLFYSSEPLPLNKKSQKENQSYPLDFYALGGNHFFNLYENIENKIIGASPGSCEAVKSDEIGDRYALSFAIKANEIKQINRLTVNTVTLSTETIKCNYDTKPAVIYNFLEKNPSSNTILTLHITGEKSFILDKKQINIYKEKYKNIIIIDETIPDINKIIEKFADEDSFRGEFFKSLKEKIKKTRPLNNNSLENFAMIINIIANTDIKLTEDELCKLLNA